MNSQPNLFDFDAGLRLKEQGIAQVEANANPAWKQEAHRQVLILAQAGAEFTTDDVWARLEGRQETPEPRAMGAVMLKASRQGVIRMTGQFRQSKRPECHGRRIAVWVRSEKLC